MCAHMYNNGCNIIGDNKDVYSKVWVVAVYIYILHFALRYLQYMCDWCFLYCSSSSAMVSVNSLSHHPNQPHLISAGCDNGAIGFLDLREERIPISFIQGHTQEGKVCFFNKRQRDRERRGFIGCVM